MKKYIVRLARQEREQLEEIISTGKSTAHKQTRARILLKADQRRKRRWLTDQGIADAVEVSIPTVERVRKIFVEEGFDMALNFRKPRGRPPRKVDGDIEARLVTLACSKPPEGRQRWTLQLLADELVQLNLVDSISYEAVRTTLKKMNLSLG